mmetsp:Transcript_31465/g.83843  ORF Transcript_31465/g.83843 Transcript_31465/m.83843 type:complete len:212 (+) Transcript_31465:3572-4207(+)
MRILSTCAGRSCPQNKLKIPGKTFSMRSYPNSRIGAAPPRDCNNTSLTNLFFKETVWVKSGPLSPAGCPVRGPIRRFCCALTASVFVPPNWRSTWIGFLLRIRNTSQKASTSACCERCATSRGSFGSGKCAATPSRHCSRSTQTRSGESLTLPSRGMSLKLSRCGNMESKPYRDCQRIFCRLRRSSISQRGSGPTEDQSDGRCTSRITAEA